MPIIPQSFYVTKVECCIFVAVNKVAVPRVCYVRTTDRERAIQTMILQLTANERQQIDYIYATTVEWRHIEERFPILDPIKQGESIAIA